VLCPVAAGALFLARALVTAAVSPVAFALALRAVVALAGARGPASGLGFALAFGFRPGRAGGVGMALQYTCLTWHFSIAVRPAPALPARSPRPDPIYLVESDDDR
jgi:hypothetical protein